MTETVAVQVWKGAKSTYYDDLLEQEPTVYELEPADPIVLDALSEDDRVLLEEDIRDHSTYAFQVRNDDRPITINVHTCDSYNNREDWSDPIERGLRFWHENDAEPFKTEIWGRVMMWAEEPEEAELS